MPLYDEIGIGYDTTRRADPTITAGLIEGLRTPTGTILDLASGSGNYTTALRRKRFDVIGLELSNEMLAQARAKGGKWVRGNVLELPFADDSFSGISCVLALHHFANLEAVFNESGRVLQAGKRIVLFTGLPDQMRHYWLNAYFPEMMERSIEQMPSRDRIESALKQAGFPSIEVHPWEIPFDPVDYLLYCGKRKPRHYLNPQVRSGISSFANLAVVAEVEAGLDRLAQDIATGQIGQIQSEYASNGGDYAFISAKFDSR